VKIAEERRDVDLSTGTEDQPGCCILDRLESVEQLTRQFQYVLSSGSEFQTVGPATEKARRPYLLSR